MRRLLVLTLIASLGAGSTAFAGESLVQSAARIVREAAQAPGGATDSSTTSQRATWVKQTGAGRTEMLQGQPALSKSGMKKSTKIMIYLAAGVGFAAAAYVIDHKVLDVTPSSLGTRQD